ncbi:hypothetical protein HRR83_000043 [Exophiala dermatitidis]|uniref:Secreted protein n=1 Tax=Exophiala dermatitidis TaxID=5970 RepID=A0AAN6J297_EXODE|nr:hypothetical protein HRR73_002577 [Exophiala dermatitidis]KAJ4527292.1 hypothetical protein HRR74_000044 [Exophiala dermatitidis]KAJ4530845.1 hypothetical protein HRR76_008539 [Exophiala dermatitidis]KAJ4558017.1 hypothetical protein HRR77_000044 [Exophiala dermatitidis]KAJ4581954.1 hypothetical protein HRR79_000954 [Exophiala dermatitidis]
MPKCKADSMVALFWATGPLCASAFLPCDALSFAPSFHGAAELLQGHTSTGGAGMKASIVAQHWQVTTCQLIASHRVSSFHQKSLSKPRWMSFDILYHLHSIPFPAEL